VGDYKVIILPNVRLLADEHAELLLDYVRGGGKLLTTEQTGAFDALFRRREASPLTPGRLGKGQIVHIPTLDHPRQYSYQPEDWYIDPRLWGLPKNHRQFTGELRKLLGNDATLEIQAPFGCISGLFRKHDRYVLHLLNYHTDKSLANITVRLRLPRKPKVITQLSPEEGSDRPVAFGSSNKAITFRVPSLRRYRVYVIDT
jgi:hypothetical protein